MRSLDPRKEQDSYDARIWGFKRPIVTKNFRYLKWRYWTLCSAILGWVFPYISRIHTAYIGVSYLHFRYLKSLVILDLAPYMGVSKCRSTSMLHSAAHIDLFLPSPQSQIRESTFVYLPISSYILKALKKGSCKTWSTTHAAQKNNDWARKRITSIYFEA